MINTIYTITTIDGFQEDEFSKSKMRPIEPRTVGWFLTLEDAQKIVDSNIGDIRETCYEYAVIQEVPVGLYPFSEHTWWYQWSTENEKYEPIEIPYRTDYEYICYAIG